MKKKILIVLLFLVGIGLFSYSYVADYFSQKNATKVIEDYSAAVETLDAETKQQYWKDAQDYNDKLSGKAIRDPFVPGSGAILDKNYPSILNVDGIIGHVSIPKIDIHLAIYHGTSDAVLKKGIGHLEGSALPVGGEGNHAVLTGHTGLINAKLFTDLIEMEEGDLFYIKVLEETLAYEVDQIKVIMPENTADLQPISKQDYVTLMTCTPYGINNQRLLVRGKRVPYTEEAVVSNSGWTKEQKLLFFVEILTAAIMTIAVIIVIWNKRRLERQKTLPEQPEQTKKTPVQTKIIRRRKQPTKKNTKESEAKETSYWWNDVD